MKRSALVVTVVPLVAVAFLLVNFAPAPWTPVRIFGLLVVLASGAALTIARLQLGNSFSIRPEAHELVVTGIYSRVRNPVYVFGVLLLAGLLLYLDRPKYSWLLLILIPMQVLRARAESRVLEERFGDAYRQYKSRTWF
ncbi:MAG: isoprenylcysteine carboxylmethyltransferase family protein [Candidatus Acidiferrum sp.]|jgi:protein-S-isoprenylcysteine O-methyltransferase Ste14